jgi:dihydrofolate synthase/folylpolyglutamate synthase
MTTEATLRWLTGLRNLGSRLGTERMGVLAARLAHPERAAPCIHVAGTNGKGSTCAMIEAIQRAHGRRTGLYTSPHLVTIGERIQVDRRPLSDERVVALAEILRPHHAAIAAAEPDLAPTFFELITAAAWIEFALRRVDVIVLETGLGGRLDATNICAPEVCVITSIGLDHQEYLGPTLAHIAAEKAGILKPGVPAVIGLVPPPAEAVIAARAQAIGAPLYWLKDYFPDGLPETNLVGAHQRANAGLALLACELAEGLPVDEATARAALRQVDWAGRWQRLTLADGRALIVDGSHNEEGIRAVVPLLAAGPPPTLVVGALGAERAQALLAAVAPLAARLHLVAPDNERACRPAELAAWLPPADRAKASTATVAELFPSPGVCRADGDPIVVLGSLYLVGEVLARFHGGALPDAGWQDRLPPTS